MRTTDSSTNRLAFYDAWVTSLTARLRGGTMPDDYRFETLGVVLESLDRRLSAAIGLMTDVRSQLALVKRMVATGRDKPDPPDAA